MNVIIKPIVTEKMTQKTESLNDYGFVVNRKANKIEIKKAVENRNNSKSLHYYTSKINKNFSDKKKILLVETLWEIVLSDGEIHDYESSLIRRLSGLLYISDVNSGNARKRALNKILSN